MTKIAVLVAAEGVEEAELLHPWAAVEKAGHTSRKPDDLPAFSDALLSALPGGASL